MAYGGGDKITITPEVRLGRLEREFQKMINQSAKAAGATEQAFQKTNQGAQGAERSMKRTSFATANLAAQLNDIGVSLAGGQSPFQVMIQQGTQVSQIFTQSGSSVKSFMSLLGGAAMSVINPFSLATFALIGLGGAALQYGSKLMGATSDADEAIKRHKEMIASVKESYGEAAEGIDAYVSRLGESELGAGVRMGVAEAEASLRSFTEELANSFIAMQEFDQRTGQIRTFLDQKYEAFDEPIRAFQAALAEGKIDIVEFQNAIDAIAEANPELRPLADEIILLAQNASAAERRLNSAEAAMATIGSVASDQVGDVKALTSALNELAGIAAPALSEADRIRKAHAEGMKNAGSDAIQREAVRQATAGAWDRLSRQSLPGGGAIPVPGEKPVLLGIAPPKSSSGGGGGSKRSPADRYGESIEQVQARIDALNAETQALSQLNPLQKDYGQTLMEVQTRQQLLAEAKKRDIELSPAQIQQIDELARKMGEASAASQRLAESQREAARAAEELANFQKGVMKGFVSDIMNGVSATEALENALGKVADRLIDIAINSAFDGWGGSGGGILGMLGLGGGGGGFKANTTLGSILTRGFATGTANTGGSRGQPMGVVHGQEAVIPLPSGGKVPVEMSGRSAQQQTVRLIVEAEEGELFRPTVRAESRNVALDVTTKYNKAERNRFQNGGRPK